MSGSALPLTAAASLMIGRMPQPLVFSLTLPERSTVIGIVLCTGAASGIMEGDPPHGEKTR